MVPDTNVFSGGRTARQELADQLSVLLSYSYMVRGDAQCSLTAYYSLVVAQDMNEPNNLVNYAHNYIYIIMVRGEAHAMVSDSILFSGGRTGHERAD